MESILSSQSANNLTAKEILNSPAEIEKRSRLAYWISDETKAGGGYYKLVKTQDEVPKGVPFQECIIMP